MELLVEDMKNNDINVRIGVMKNLSIIARELGPDKTVYELLPFLIQKVHDEDEVFYEMACQISSLLEYIGDEKNIVHLFPLIELLMSIEESIVRTEAINAFKDIVTKLSQNVVEDLIFPLYFKQFDTAWFSKKVSACSLLDFIMPLVSNENKLLLLEKSITLSSDDMPLVRRANINSIANCLKIIYESNFMLDEELEEEYKSFSELITDKNAFFVFKKFIPQINQITNDEDD